MKSFLLVLSIFVAVPDSFASSVWDLNDVSYLMPLPKEIGTDSLLRLSSKGLGDAAILSPKMVEDLPHLAMHRQREDLINNLRVIGVRIDPCFPLPTPQSCQRQIRLMWQPLEKGPRNSVITVDAALHSFYQLTDEEFGALLKDLQDWKNRFNVETGFKPLQIHPAWADAGDKSPALAEFNKIILKYIGPQNMIRVTMMLLRGGGNMWVFAGFEMKEGMPELGAIPRLGDKKSQAFLNLSAPQDYFERGGLTPIPKEEDTINNLVADSKRFEEGMDDVIISESRAAFRIENPKFFNPENMDCASCHTAQPALAWVNNKHPQLKVSELWSKEIYKNAKYNLENTSPVKNNTHSVRAFGYFDKNVAISQRMINESAEVADLVNQFISLKKGK